MVPLAVEKAGHEGEGSCCVIGAGPAGLCVADALLRAGLKFDVYERNSGVGGIWDIDRADTPMYETAHMISSRDRSAFRGFPMPREYPDYPSHRQVLDYLRDFARRRGILSHIWLGQEVRRVERLDGGWRVHLPNGHSRDYRWLVCAPGANRDPVSPRIPGEFSGTVMHARDYRSPDQLQGRRVLVVGGGNSGCDIACDAAEHATRAFISLRRGYHIVPKYVFGMPADVFEARSPPLPAWLRQRLMSLVLASIASNPVRHGWPRPDHRLFESHPILNSRIRSLLQERRLRVKPDVASLDGTRVVFSDQSTEEIDVVILATGYRMSLPFLDETIFQWDRGRPRLYLQLFHPHHDDLFVVGLIETNRGIFPFLSLMAHVVAMAIRDLSSGNEAAARLATLRRDDRPDLSGGIRFVDSDRHCGYVDARSYERYLCRLIGRMGWPMPGTAGGVR